ncbi:MAG: NAD(P)H-hydrate dehydratase [Alphaproteobacteria bacterium]|nr:NAD(P)H-hydrate dehydratase [Alphaproteobacteria bacterium]MCD8526339.1 NAD(P)H-hydrate dehydratase [Alphaproteobacteria bacterium]MCD8570145.1 NAD(P)H-hydrate dehydratase [Alphaproteobacteria bacterium]
MALIHAAPELTGATRLAAESCARIGAGMVTVLSPPKVLDVYRIALPPHIVVRGDIKWWDDRVNAVLYGPGGMASVPRLRDVPTVIDADGLGRLPKKLHERCVLTPHEGEFARAFPEIKGSREERALAAAQKTGAIIVLKGAETLIAHPDGRVTINRHASPYLATAGAGDVLAGMITGLCAQGMEPYLAACAAVWMHGDAAIKIGPGLVAPDLLYFLKCSSAL